jgi:hypothetical protein
LGLKKIKVDKTRNKTFIGQIKYVLFYSLFGQIFQHRICHVVSQLNQTSVSGHLNQTSVSGPLNRTSVSGHLNHTSVSSHLNQTSVSGHLNRTPVSGELGFFDQTSDQTSGRVGVGGLLVLDLAGSQRDPIVNLRGGKNIKLQNTEITWLVKNISFQCPIKPIKTEWGQKVKFQNTKITWLVKKISFQCPIKPIKTEGVRTSNFRTPKKICAKKAYYEGLIVETMV